MTPDCKAWTQRGFEDFSRGRFDGGGANLYVNATVYRTDLNNDGYPEEARWWGPDGEGTSYRDSVQAIRDVPASAEWLQYRVTFLHRNGARSPQLKEVRID
jgi:hypothetical protein